MTTWVSVNTGEVINVQLPSEERMCSDIYRQSLVMELYNSFYVVDILIDPSICVRRQWK